MGLCKRYAEDISALIDGELGAAEEKELRTHLRSCTACAELHRELCALHDAFPTAVEPPETLVGGTLYRTTLEGVGGNPPRWKRVAASLVGIAACLLIALYLSGGDALRGGWVGKTPATADESGVEDLFAAGGGGSPEDGGYLGSAVLSPEIENDAADTDDMVAGTPYRAQQDQESLPALTPAGELNSMDVIWEPQTSPALIPALTFRETAPKEDAGKGSLFYAELLLPLDAEKLFYSLLDEDAAAELEKSGCLRVTLDDLNRLLEALQGEYHNKPELQGGDEGLLFVLVK